MLLCKLENQNQFNLNTDCRLSRWLAGGGVVEGRHLCWLLLVMEMTLQLGEESRLSQSQGQTQGQRWCKHCVDLQSAVRGMTQHSTFIHF